MIDLDLDLNLISIAEFRNLSTEKKFEHILNGSQQAVKILKCIIKLENKILNSTCLNERKDCMENRKIKKHQLQIANETLTQYLVNFFDLERSNYKFSISIKDNAVSLYTARNKKDQDRLSHGHYGVNLIELYIFVRHYTHRLLSPEPTRYYKSPQHFEKNYFASAT